MENLFVFKYVYELKTNTVSIYKMPISKIVRKFVHTKNGALYGKYKLEKNGLKEFADDANIITSHITVALEKCCSSHTFNEVFGLNDKYIMYSQTPNMLKIFVYDVGQIVKQKYIKYFKEYEQTQDFIKHLAGTNN